MECPSRGLFSQLLAALDELLSLETLLSSQSYLVKSRARIKAREVAQRAATLCKCLLEAMRRSEVCSHTFEEYKELVEKGEKAIKSTASKLGVSLGSGPLVRPRRVTLSLLEVGLGYVECRKVEPAVRDLCNALEVFASVI